MNMPAERELIERFFLRLGAPRGDVRLGIGDDAAVVTVPDGQELVLTTDTLVEGTHFLPAAPARSIGHRALAVNLSDIAAMAAAPAWALLSLTLPRVDEAWLAGFAAGFDALAQRHGVALVGGNLTRGPLAVTVQVAGLVREGCALRRSTARAGDLLCVTGTPGDAAAALAISLGKLASPSDSLLLERFEFPTPRVELGRRLHGIASAAIDISDGLLADATRLADASQVALAIDAGALPLSASLCAAAGEQAAHYAVQGGEDYELALAVPPGALPALQQVAADCATRCSVIGAFAAGAGVSLRRGGDVIHVSSSGFDHFAS